MVVTLITFCGTTMKLLRGVVRADCRNINTYGIPGRPSSSRYRRLLEDFAAVDYKVIKFISNLAGNNIAH